MVRWIESWFVDPDQTISSCPLETDLYGLVFLVFLTSGAGLYYGMESQPVGLFFLGIGFVFQTLLWYSHTMKRHIEYLRRKAIEDDLDVS